MRQGRRCNLGRCLDAARHIGFVLGKPLQHGVELDQALALRGAQLGAHVNQAGFDFGQLARALRPIMACERALVNAQRFDLVRGSVQSLGIDVALLGSGAHLAQQLQRAGPGIFCLEGRTANFFLADAGGETLGRIRSPARNADEHDGQADQVTEEEIRMLVAESHEQGVIDVGERNMINRVLRLGDRSSAGLMTPRTRIVWLDASASFEENLEVMRETPFARYPVYRGSDTEVLGILETKSLTAMIGRVGSNAELFRELGPSLFVSESTQAM